MQEFKLSKYDDYKLKFSCKFEDCFELTRGLINDHQLNAILYAPEMYNFLVNMKNSVTDKGVIPVNYGDLIRILEKIDGKT